MLYNENGNNVSEVSVDTVLLKGIVPGGGAVFHTICDSLCVLQHSGDRKIPANVKNTKPTKKENVASPNNRTAN